MGVGEGEGVGEAKAKALAKGCERSSCKSRCRRSRPVGRLQTQRVRAVGQSREVQRPRRRDGPAGLPSSE